MSANGFEGQIVPRLKFFDFHPLHEVEQVGGVGGERVGGEATFDFAVAEEFTDRDIEA